MGGSESCVTNATDTLQTECIYIRWAFRDKPFLHTPVLWTPNRIGRKKKSRHGITIRKNKQSEGTTEGLTSHLNRTESSRSNKVGLTPHMIPCFPANNSTDAHHCDIISNRSSPSHFTKDSPFNISQVRTRPTTNNLCHCLKNQKG